jgi:ABC-2 type transport system ATP-binding protein/lipopolysaccharide transport system ATP-binding protein
VEKMDNIAISVQNVSMMFNLSRDKVFSLKEYVVKMLQRKLFFDEFWALKNVSFEVRRGEVFGILGLNGAGKSTLLKIVAGVFKPTQGTVVVNGEISPLLELGTGFDFEFSARENIYMNGAMFGHSPKYMDSLYNEIMDFSELWEFEGVPIKNFSSGMSARLGFAVATSVKPQVLILDEILGVGDFRFQQKCKDRIKTMLEGGTTVLLVAHSIDAIKSMCNRGKILKKGEVVSIGDVDEICEAYQGESVA